MSEGAQTFALPWVRTKLVIAIDAAPDADLIR